jgi:hypothetical protein
MTTTAEPHELTSEEIQNNFLEYVRSTIKYWADTPLTRDIGVSETEQRIAGAAFSILCAIDGCAADLPGFVLAPRPHQDDKAYNQENGDNWYPRLKADITSDISGNLHERLQYEKWRHSHG